MNLFKIKYLGFISTSTRTLGTKTKNFQRNLQTEVVKIQYCCPSLVPFILSQLLRVRAQILKLA